MAYRRIDILAANLALEDIQSVLEDVELLESYQTALASDRAVATLLVDEGYTEAVLDQLSQRYGKQDDVRIMTTPVNTVLPPPEKEEQEEDADTQSPEEEKQQQQEQENHSRRISRDELMEELRPGSEIHAIYLAQVVLSSLVASIGMIRDSVALVIAAMMIAPLLLPNMSLALGTTLGDLRLVRRSFQTLAVGVFAGLVVPVVMVWIVSVDMDVSEIAIRTQPNMSDLVVAMAAGTAGALAVTTGVSATMIGVMVAVALLPPLVAVGLALGQADWAYAFAAMALLGANLVSVNLAAVIVFLVLGIRPSTWHEEERARTTTRIAVVGWVVLLLLIGLVLWWITQHGS